MFNTIATMVGFLIVLGSVGGMEQTTSDAILVQCGMLAVAGLALMWAGVTAINRNTDETIESLYQSNTYGGQNQYRNRLK